ncbi:MAG: extracellular solute-binding protein [Aliidongia sp.]
MGVDWCGIVGVAGALTLAGSVAAAPAWSGSAMAEEQPKLLHLANRPDFIAEDTVQKFEAETGIKVTYDTYPSDESLLAALKSGNKQGWDLVVTAAVPDLVQALADHLLQPIEPGKLSNAGNLDPEVEAALAGLDLGNKFAVPYLWGSAGLGINTALLKKTVPDAPTDSLALIFDPVLAAQVGGCGVAMADSPEDVVPAALAFLGLDPTTQDEKSLAKAGDLLAKLKPIVRRLPLGDFAEQLGSGKICVGFGPSTEVSDARTRADDIEDGPDITYVVPKERSRRWIDVFVLPAGAANTASAYAFIDYVLRPEIISDITDLTGAANPNTLAVDFVDEDDKTDETVFPSAASRARLFLDKPLSPEADKARQRIWARTKP